jgi:hypothetical protein
MTDTVDSNAITASDHTCPFITSKDSIIPTLGARNIIGKIANKNLATSSTCSSLIIPVSKHKNMMTSPYTLAGTGSGMKWFSTSPMKLIVTITANCFKYFTIIPSLLTIYILLYPSIIYIFHK